TLIATRAYVIVENPIAAVLAGCRYRSMLVSKTELEFVITTPILLEVVGIKSDVRLGSLGVIELESIFQEEVAVETEDRLRIGANSAKWIQVELVLDVRILCIHKPVRVRDESMFELEQV